MGQDKLIYSLVARGTVVLADFTAIHSSANAIAAQCLTKMPSNTTRFTYTCEDYTFNFLLDAGLTYMVVAEESMERSLIYALLESIKDDFKARFGGGKTDTAASHSLDREFRPKLKEHMQNCVDHPEKLDSLANIKSQVNDVKAVMMGNIEKVLDRGEKISLMVDKAENLRHQATVFEKQGKQLKWSLWIQNMKIKLVVLAIVIALILIIWLSICKGFTCSSNN